MRQACALNRPTDSTAMHRLFRGVEGLLGGLDVFPHQLQEGGDRPTSRPAALHAKTFRSLVTTAT